jgi:hypothetical protein
VNAGRLIDFLLLEHLGHGGAENGKLKAPQDQLQAFGIGARYISEAITQAEGLGLVDCHRHGRRVASTYTLTWLPEHDGTPPSNRWRSFRNPDLQPLPAPKSRNLPLKGKVALPLKGKVDGVNLPLKGKVDGPENLPLKGKVLSRCSYQGRGCSKEEEGGGADAVGSGEVPSAGRDDDDEAVA